MNTSSKIWIDRTLGLPLVLAMNGAARLLAVFARRDHSVRPGNVRRIVVAKFLGMGSIIHATPMIANLRAQFPDAEILFLTARRNSALVGRLDGISGVIVVDDESFPRLLISTLRALMALARPRADLYFDLEVYSTYSSLMGLCSISRNRYGLYRHFARFKKGIYTHLLYFNARRPIRMIYSQLARLSGVTAAMPDRLGPIRVTEEDRESLKSKYPTLAAASYVVFNPNASDLLVERRWPLHHFAAAARHAASRNVTVCLVGSKGEAAYTAQLERLLDEDTRRHAVNTAGTLELGELLALLQGARAVVTNDSGPMHMAVALNVPTLCLFGPVEPAHYGFTRADVGVLYHPVYCSPCAHEVDRPPCNGVNECMRRILPSEVIQWLDRALNGQHVVIAPDTCIGISDAQGDPLGMVTRNSVPRTSQRRPDGDASFSSTSNNEAARPNLHWEA